MVICLEQGADLHTAQLMLLPLTVSCFFKIQIGFAFLVPAHSVVPDKGPLNGCVCVCVHYGPANWPFVFESNTNQIGSNDWNSNRISNRIGRI